MWTRSSAGTPTAATPPNCSPASSRRGYGPTWAPRRVSRYAAGAMASTLFEDLGGEAALRPIIDRFVDRVFDDVMIGFFFRNARRERVKAMEYEFAAKHLGADIEYTGRPLDAAHRAHPIMG